MNSISTKRLEGLKFVHQEALRMAQEGRKGFDDMEPHLQDNAISRAKINTVMRRLKGAATICIPEQVLMLSIIEKALTDAEIVTTGSFTPGAQAYFNMNRHEPHCSAIDLDSEFVRMTLRKFFVWAE